MLKKMDFVLCMLNYVSNIAYLIFVISFFLYFLYFSFNVNSNINSDCIL